MIILLSHPFLEIREMRFRDIKTLVPKAAVISSRGSVSLDAEGLSLTRKIQTQIPLVTSLMKMSKRGPVGTRKFGDSHLPLQ